MGVRRTRRSCLKGTGTSVKLRVELWKYFLVLVSRGNIGASRLYARVKLQYILRIKETDRFLTLYFTLLADTTSDHDHCGLPLRGDLYLNAICFSLILSLSHSNLFAVWGFSQHHSWTARHHKPFRVLFSDNFHYFGERRKRNVRAFTFN